MVKISVIVSPWAYSRDQDYIRGSRCNLNTPRERARHFQYANKSLEATSSKIQNYHT